MGWFCSEIMAQPSVRLIEILRQTPGFEEELYYVPGVEGPLRANFPKDGLVFVRNVGNALFDETPVPWPSLSVGVDVELSIPLDQPKLRNMEGEDVSTKVPESFLKYLKWLSGETKSVVAYYSDHSWGGPIEFAFAYVFEPQPPHERVFCSIYDEPRIRVYREGLRPSEEEITVLAMTLWRLGVDAPKWEFAPHCKGFDWRSYRERR